MANFKTGFAVPPAMAKDQSCQVSFKNSKIKGNFFRKNLDFGLRLLNKLGPLVAKSKTGMVVPPAMAKDQSCQVSSKNSKNKGNFLTNYWGRAYPTVITILKKGRPSLRSGLNKIFIMLIIGS